MRKYGTVADIHDLEEFTEILDKDTLQSNVAILEKSDCPDVLDTIALGLTYHEICVLYFIQEKNKLYAPYAQKALHTLESAQSDAPNWSIPLLNSYIVSAQSLVAATKSNPIGLLKVIRRYDELINTYAESSYHPEFLQASLLENLPNVFGTHAKAQRRFKSIINKYNQNPAYANQKVLSFCYLSLGKLAKDERAKRSLLSKSIEIDASGTGGSAQAKRIRESL